MTDGSEPDSTESDKASDATSTEQGDDSGLISLALVAGLHNVPLDIEALSHSLALGTGKASSSELIRAAKLLGFKTREVSLTPGNIAPNALPAIACTAVGEFFVIARSAKGADGQTRFLIKRINQAGAEEINATQLEELWTGSLILISGGSSSGKPGAPFNLRWFVPSLVKYKNLFMEVILASFFLQLFALITPLFFQVVMDKVLVHQGFTTLNVLAIGLAVILVFDAIIGGLRNYLFSHTSTRIDVELGARLFRHLANLPLSYFEARQVGQTVARVRELDTIRNFITGTALTLLIDVFFTFVFFLVLWLYSPTLTLIVLGSLPCYIVLSVVITPLLRTRLEEKFRHGALNQSFLTECVTGIHTVKAQAVEPQMQQKWEAQLADYVTSAFKSQNLTNIANQFAGLFSKVTTLLVIWCGAHLVIAGAMTVGQLVAFNMIAGRITAPVLKLVQLWQDFQQAGISLHRLGDILNAPEEPGSLGSGSAPSEITGAIELERVRFRYNIQGPLVTDELSLSIAPGEIIGIVGRSGSGKSTLTKLIQRLYVPEAGRVMIDGHDLAVVRPSWLRQKIGVVQQESFLFNRSVRQNIALSNPAAPFDRVVECAKTAGAHEFILQLHEGYDTLLGEQGSNLSGGQRQRIAIARALLGDPRILILDEATSALDYESERIVQQNMGAISQGRTVLMIAHRLSTIRHCDRIIVLDQGRVMEEGCHDALMEADGYYAQLYGYQNHNPRIRTVTNRHPPRNHTNSDNTLRDGEQ